MGIALFALSFVLYLALVVDWKELMAVIRQGAWPAISVYCVLTLLISYVLTCPAAMPAAGGHH